MNHIVGWSLAAVAVNYVIFTLTGVPFLWLAICIAAKPLAYYVAIVNLTMAVGIVAAGMLYGTIGAVKMAVLLFGFNLVPSILAAVMGFGHGCR